MGLTQKLGTIPLAIQTDSSNNVGIGGTPSGSFKLEVTGASKLSGFLGVNGSPATSFPFEAYINSSTAYSSTSRGNVMRVYNSNTGANVFAGIELGGAGTANDGLAGLNAVVTGSGSAALTFYTRDGGTFAERFRVSATGNVGIGTSSPITLFQVRNNMWQHYISKYFTSQTNFLSVNIPNNGACFITIVSSAYRPGVDTYSQAVKFAIIVRAGNTTITSDGNYGNTTEVGYSISGATTTFYFRYAGGSTNYQNAFITLQAVSQNGYEESVNITLL